MNGLKYLVIICLSLLSCKAVKTAGAQIGKSDPKAIEIADKVIKAMGGSENWDKTHYLKWNFFGRRKLLWDKWTGWVRIETTKKNLIIAVNVNDTSGAVWKDGQQIDHPDSLATYLDLGRKIWINDAYWLVMPFKLRDPGVTLKYLGESTDDDGQAAHLLQLTFDGVGVTPENKYQVWVDKTTFLITQWAYYEQAQDETPQIQNPWKDYLKVGNILLSGNRGEKRKLTEIESPSVVPKNIFSEVGQFML